MVDTIPTSHQSQEGDADRADKHDYGYYEDHIRRDLDCRVFVDFEVFMKRVLHVPDDWRTRWGPAIDAVKADAKFNKQHERYCALCEEGGTLEKELSADLTETANAVLEVLSRSDFKGIPLEERQHYRVSDSTHLEGGVMEKENLSPDLILLNEDRSVPCPKKTKSARRVNPLHTLDVNPRGNALCDGRNIPRFAVDGKCAR